MASKLTNALNVQVQRGGDAYIRNLAAAEAAVLRGQFNLAKVLRALAHEQRVVALAAARLSVGDSSLNDLLQANLADLQRTPASMEVSAETQAKLEQFAQVQARARDLLVRAMKSLETHADVRESDVAQSLWGCYQCGYLAEANRPDVCPVCGAIAAEFEWFGPFYSATPEHLGQRTPTEIIRILETAPDDVAEIISGFDDAALSRKPSETEWCAKEIVGHMLETDALFGKRAAALLREQGVPNLAASIPPWKLHEGKGYEQMAVGEIVARFEQTRRASLALVRGLTPEQWSRRGMNNATSTSLIDLGTWLANHDLGHIAQIGRLRSERSAS